ncbi:MAG: hypothetical protein R3B06_04255 [Kofleriaceae bacterium]
MRPGCEAAVARYRHPSAQTEAAVAQQLREPDVPAGRHAYVRMAAARSARHNQRLAQMLFERCTADRWNAAMRGCIADDGPGCPDLLPPAQYAAFDAAFTALNAELIAEKAADRSPWNPALNTTCGQASESIRRALGPLPDDAARALAVTTQRACMRWHFTAVNCFGDAGDRAALQACDAYLTADQQAELHAALAPGPD